MAQPNSPKHHHVAVGLIIDAEGRLLLQHRDDKPGIPGPGLWGFFGGHVEPAERPAAAFLREMDEELGWRPRHFEPYLRREISSLDAGRDEDTTVTSHVFAAHLDVPFDQLTLAEGQDMRLYALDALPHAIVPNTPGVISAFAASDAYKRVRRAWDIITATAILVDRNGRFLLQHRDDKPEIDNPGQWGSFGGRIEPYETPEDGFLRELQEELSWQPQSFELHMAVPYRPDERRQLIYIYAAPVEVGLDRLVLGEGQGMAFFAPDDLSPQVTGAYAELLRSFATTDTYVKMREQALR